ncbi:hypothetical protein TNCV_1817791 [Trichonephila clavipes]|nr:hypothetical protein TNCV_1817791 [Trichonephila clavipes]
MSLRRMENIHFCLAQHHRPSRYGIEDFITVQMPLKERLFNAYSLTRHSISGSIRHVDLKYGNMFLQFRRNTLGTSFAEIKLRESLRRHKNKYASVLEIQVLSISIQEAMTI